MIRETHQSGYYCLTQMDGRDLMDPINGKWLKRCFAWRRKLCGCPLSLVFLFIFPLLFLFISPSDYVTEEIVTFFHEYAMKKYEVLASCHSNSKEKIETCSIITNPNCGKHKPSNYGRKHISVLCDITKTEKTKK